MTDADRPATGPDWPTIDAELAEHEGDFDSPQWRATGEDAAPRTEAGRDLLHAIDSIGDAHNIDIDYKAQRRAILAIEAEAAQRAAAPCLLATFPEDNCPTFAESPADWCVNCRAAQGAAAPPTCQRCGHYEGCSTRCCMNQSQPCIRAAQGAAAPPALDVDALIADMPVAILATDGGPAVAYAMRIEAYLRARLSGAEEEYAQPDTYTDGRPIEAAQGAAAPPLRRLLRAIESTTLRMQDQKPGVSAELADAMVEAQDALTEQGAAAPPDLDVERLVRAFYNTPRKPGLAETEAEHIARASAEYARLSGAPTDSTEDER